MSQPSRAPQMPQGGMGGLLNQSIPNTPGNAAGWLLPLIGGMLGGPVGYGLGSAGGMMAPFALGERQFPMKDPKNQWLDDLNNVDQYGIWR